MTKAIEHVHWPNAPDMWMPYAPAIKVKGGTTVYLAGVTAAPVYHHHPHRPEEFDAMPRDMEGQARAALENLKRGLEAVGATFADVVTADRFVTDLSYQDALNRVWGEYFRDDDGAGGAACHRSALPRRNQCGGGDRLIGRRPPRYPGSENLMAKITARITTAGLASSNLPAISLANA